MYSAHQYIIYILNQIKCNYVVLSLSTKLLTRRNECSDKFKCKSQLSVDRQCANRVLSKLYMIGSFQINFRLGDSSRCPISSGIQFNG